MGAQHNNMNSHVMMANQTIKQLLQLLTVANEDVCLNHELNVVTEAVGNI